MDVSVVVPLFNEAENVRPLHAALTAVMRGLGKRYELILVDDGSRDGTTERLREIAAADPCVKVVLFRSNFGQTAALSAGLRHAAGAAVVTLDGDLQNDPADIPMLLAKLDEGYDFVHGWRKDRQDALVLRKIPSRIANRLIAKVTGVAVHDLGCALKAMRGEVARELRLYGDMHRFVTILAARNGARCCEVVTRHHTRRHGQSKYGLSRTVRVVLDLVTVYYLTRHLRNPMRLFGGAGLACGVVGALSAAATVGMKLFGGVDMTGNPLLLLTVLSARLGVQFLALGLLGELGTRIFYEVRGGEPYAIREMLNFERPETIVRRAA
ncbi:MAG TPA: glycosyltransferase family 2 protein [Planctomycetaceae bacterium]